MNDHIHLDTIKNLFLKQYGIQSEIVCQQAANQHQYCTMIVEKDSNVALVTFKGNESNFNEDTVILINNDGQQINNGRILFFTMSDVNIFTHSPYRWCIDEQLIKDGKLKLLRKPASAEELQELQKLEAERYPRSTGIILNATICGSDLSECMVDKIVYTDDYKFSELQRGCNSNILTEYNKSIYDSYVRGRNTLLVINETTGDGILIDSQGYDYPRYYSYIPKISHFIDHWMDTEMEQRAQQTLKLYVPLQVHYVEHGQDYMDIDELDTVRPGKYYNEIKKALKQDCAMDGKRGLAQYLHDDALKSKIYQLSPDIEYHEGTVYGVMIVKITEPLTENELNELKDYCTGQFSDGFGEHFEQQEIAVDGGNIYVHFWNSSEEYDIKTEDELLGQERSQTLEMEGPTLSM